MWGNVLLFVFIIVVITVLFSLHRYIKNGRLFTIIKKRGVFSILPIVLLLYNLFYFPESYENVFESMNTRTLEKDGFAIYYDTEYSKNPLKLQQDVLSKLPTGFLFMDYEYKIKNTSLSTFHRDVTSSKNIYNTKHKVYSLIVYNYSGELLSICPSSDKSYPFVTSRIVNIDGPMGTAILFDSDILHAGRFNHCQYREVIQYKICHYEDIPLLQHLQGIHLTKDEICDDSFLHHIRRKFSYYFEFPINYIFYPLISKRYNDSFIGRLQSFIPIEFYNNA